MKNLSVIGIGKLGLCFALTLEKAGYSVVGMDVRTDYVERVNSKTLESSEPGVVEALRASTRLRATTSLEETLAHSDVLFLVVGTPSLESGRYDHSQVDGVINSIIALTDEKPFEHTKHIVICCTVMPKYTDSVARRLAGRNFTVSYNPEFIAQGTIMRDQEQPDMVLIGEGSKEIGDILESIYIKHTSSNPKICRMSPIEAEITKISLNCFLTTKIAFANMVGDIAIASGTAPNRILEAIGSDTRVGPKYLRYGFGFGGPCFPRDNKALGIYASDLDSPAEISKATDISNRLHLLEQVKLFDKGNRDKKHVPFTMNKGEVCYKKGSTIIEESQQLLFAKSIASLGYKVIIKDCKEVVDQVKEIHGKLFTYEIVED